MKYSSKITVIIAIAALSFTSTSCNKDKEDPTIEISAPAKRSMHNWGNEVHLMATFGDDQGLKDYTVMIGDADGNHSHAFDFMKTGTTTEITYAFHEHFMVPDSAPEMAWAYFTVTDAEDKTSTMKWMLHFEE